MLDQSLIQLEAKGKWVAVRLGSTSKVKLSDLCLTLGYPQFYYREGRQPLLRIGRVLNLSPQHLFTSVKIMGGDSGGPLFNLNGELIGTNRLMQYAGLGSGQVHIDIYKMIRRELLADKHTRQVEADSPPIKEWGQLPVLQQARKSVVGVIAEGKPVGFGIVVDPKGLVITKASELIVLISCRLYDGTTVAAQIVGRDIQHDLALLKIPVGSLAAVLWNSAKIAVGQNVATLGSDADPLNVSVVGSSLIDVEPEYGELTINVKPSAHGTVPML